MAPAQSPRRACAQMVVHEMLAETKPEYRERRLAAEAETKRSIEVGEATRVVDKLITIQVVVHVVHIGGDFGGKGSPDDAMLTYHLARASGRPVSMVLSYAEELTAANPRHPATVYLKTGVKRDASNSRPEFSRVMRDVNARVQAQMAGAAAGGAA